MTSTPNGARVPGGAHFIIGQVPVTRSCITEEIKDKTHTIQSYMYMYMTGPLAQADNTSNFSSK